MSTHTPIPWKIDKRGADVDIMNDEGITVAMFGAGEGADEDAKFAVQAVNSHDALVEALKELDDLAELVARGREHPFKLAPSCRKADRALRLSRGNQ